MKNNNFFIKTRSGNYRNKRRRKIKNPCKWKICTDEFSKKDKNRGTTLLRPALARKEPLKAISLCHITVAPVAQYFPFGFPCEAHEVYIKALIASVLHPPTSLCALSRFASLRSNAFKKSELDNYVHYYTFRF